MTDLDGKPTRVARRDFLRAIPALAFPPALAAAGARDAVSCILVWQEGGASQLDTFDMKPGAPAEIRGPFREISTTVPGLRICGKTGTAQIQDERNIKTGQTTWFASFAPYESPRWAVVVMVEDGASGGDTCSPVAKPIYTALLERERARAGKNETMAKAN